MNVRYGVNVHKCNKPHLSIRPTFFLNKMQLLHNNHLLYIEDLSYQDKRFCMPNGMTEGFLKDEWIDQPPDPDRTHIVLEEPYLIIETLDSCYSHALLDRIFPLFWAIQTIRNEFPTLTQPIRIMVKHRMIRAFPDQNLPLIDRGAGYYRGFHRELLSWISPGPPLFSPDDNRVYCFRRAFVYADRDDFQYSPWNRAYIYPGRNIVGVQPSFSDATIRTQLLRFRESVFRFYHIHVREEDVRDDILLVERKTDRRWDPDKIRSIPASPVILEYLPVRQQILLFATHRIIVFRHGSCLTNLLFSPPGARVFDVDHERGRPHIVGRLCEFLDLVHTYLDYHSCHDGWYQEKMKSS